MNSFPAHERDIFNGALRLTSNTYRQLLRSYRSSLAVVRAKIDEYVLDTSLSRGELKRLSQLNREIDAEIGRLIDNRARLIGGGFTSQYEQVFYRTGMAFEEWVNTVGINTPGAHYELGYSMLDRNAVAAALDERIAGETFTTRSAIERRRLQSSIRDAVAGAITRGETVADLAEQLRSVDDVFSQSANRALTTARTELLRAQSYAAEHASAVAELAGVENAYAWSATFAGNTRKAHGDANNQKAVVDDDGNITFTVGGIRFSSPRVPHEGQSGTAGQVINCRCRRRDEPYGFEPDSRRAALTGGEWEDVRGDMDWQEWSQTLEGQEQIAEVRADRLEAARERRAERREDAA